MRLRKVGVDPNRRLVLRKRLSGTAPYVGKGVSKIEEHSRGIRVASKRRFKMEYRLR